MKGLLVSPDRVAQIVELDDAEWEAGMSALVGGVVEPVVADDMVFWILGGDYAEPMPINFIASSMMTDKLGGPTEVGGNVILTALPDENGKPVSLPDLILDGAIKANGSARVPRVVVDGHHLSLIMALVSQEGETLYEELLLGDLHRSEVEELVSMLTLALSNAEFTDPAHA